MGENHIASLYLLLQKVIQRLLVLLTLLNLQENLAIMSFQYIRDLHVIFFAISI
jgi:hypothetical protein